MIDRRGVLLGGLVVPALSSAVVAAGPRGFVRVEGLRFVRDGVRYPVIGANLWYGAWLGREETGRGSTRLTRELDRLRALGVNNVRLLAAAERSPLRGTVQEVMRGRAADYDEALLRGLDRALAELARRNMTAVVYLNNFWEWSGGMAAWLTYVNGGRFVEAVDPARPWTDFPDFAAGFYGDAAAVALADGHVRAIVGRTNGVTRLRYVDDPTIMAWQLANEPRPAGTEAVYARTYPAFVAWIRGNARLIRSMAPRQLISIGSEGTIGCLAKAECALAISEVPEVDYLTAHIWPQNFGWVTRGRLAETYDRGLAETRAYLAGETALARRVSKPLVVEEFGFPRDGGAVAPGTPTGLRDRYYRALLDEVATGARGGGPLAGANFWAWNGEGRAAHPDARFRPGDVAYVGDPPHEPVGLYGVFDTDRTTRAVIRDWAGAMRAGVG